MPLNGRTEATLPDADIDSRLHRPLARLADQGRERVLELGSQIEEMQVGLDYFQLGSEWAKALIIQSRKPK